ncbi:MAG: hypothetical protein GY702_20295 [Desulfobulbaceae bacterium]|nr:hypothetical protein [Desulfobulbaceae bacterium]
MGLRRYFLSLFVILFIVLTAPATLLALPGDLDASGMVDGTDLISFGKANGTTITDANWNPDADLDNSGTVDPLDLTILSTHFAKSGLSFGLWLGDSLDGDKRIAKISEKGRVLLRQGSFQTPDIISANIKDGSVWIADSDSSQQFVRKIAGSSGNTLLTVHGLTATSLAVNSMDGTAVTHKDFSPPVA